VLESAHSSISISSNNNNNNNNNNRAIAYSQNPNMSKSTVFITGATGFIGAQITAFALRAGYKVKLSVRREAQIDSLKKAFSESADRVKFVLIPDITKTGAFDNALQGAEHVIHVASPLAIPGQDLLTPAVKGTTSVLESALKVPSIKKVVITASVASLIPLGQGGDGTVVKGKF
jgi:nucleoside-diphosphate-sugar epimerase